MNAAELINKVRRMEGAEIWFRARLAARAQAGQLAAAVRAESWQRDRLATRLVTDPGFLDTACERLQARDWAGAHLALSRHFHNRESRFPFSPDTLPALAGSIRAKFPCAADDARRRGDRLLSGRFDLLGYRDLSFASEVRGRHSIDWHYDPVHARRSPSGFWTAVRYLDPRNGDHKIIWELNRHQHWLQLGRAMWLTGNLAYRDEFIRQLEDWMYQNPPLAGTNWASSLELSLRCLSWVWALHLFLETPEPADDRRNAPWMVDLLLGIDRQLSQVEQNLSRYFSPNTHLTGEALGLYVCGIALPELTSAARWAQTGREVLLEQIDKQVLPDGGHVERSAHYHRYTLDFYLLALVVARLADDPVVERLAEAVRRLARAARLLTDDAGRLPHIGDDDGGMLFPICGRPPDDAADSLATAAVVMEEPSLALSGIPEETWWMTGADEVTHRVSSDPYDPRPGTGTTGRASGSLASTGYFVSRRRAGDHVVIDGGPHGYLNGGHAHADALAVTLAFSGEPLLVDPGTATYTMSPRLRDRFRSSQMHNTLTLDGRSQSVPGGPFHWRSTAQSTVERWLPADTLDYFEGTEDGYRPLVHRRRVLVLEKGLVVVVDSVSGETAGPRRTSDSEAARPDGIHELTAHWHLAPGWGVDRVGAQAVSLRHERGPSAWLMTSAARLELFDADEEPGLGWSSPAYGLVVPSMTIGAAVRRAVPAAIVTVIGEGPLPGDAALTALSAEAAPAADAVAFRLIRFGASRLFIFSAADTAEARTVRAGGLASNGRFTLVESDAAGWVERIALLDGGRVWNAGTGRRLVDLGGVVRGLSVDDYKGKD